MNSRCYRKVHPFYMPQMERFEEEGVPLSYEAEGRDGLTEP